MNDRELLEAAAKAAGMETRWDQQRGSTHGFIRARVPGGGDAFPVWSPLTDDGDALRLAVSLGLSVEPYPYYMQPKHSVIVKQRRHGDMMRESNPTECVELHRDSDPMGATRRAIVRAAAALGGATGAGGE